jgi:hypothetical protein
MTGRVVDFFFRCCRILADVILYMPESEPAPRSSSTPRVGGPRSAKENDLTAKFGIVVDLSQTLSQVDDVSQVQDVVREILGGQDVISPDEEDDKTLPGVSRETLLALANDIEAATGAVLSSEDRELLKANPGMKFRGGDLCFPLDEDPDEQSPISRK